VYGLLDHSSVLLNEQAIWQPEKQKGVKSSFIIFEIIISSQFQALADADGSDLKYCHSVARRRIEHQSVTYWFKKSDLLSQV
jgi:hypothetical protein